MGSRLEPTGKGQIDMAETTEEKLRKEIEDLKRQLQQHKNASSPHAHLAEKTWQPSSFAIWSIVLGLTVLIVAAFFVGWIPLHKRQALIYAEAREQEEAVPRVEVIEVARSAPKSDLQLPGSIQALTEAPILARANGYIKTRMVDIGDRVEAGQPVAEIEEPEVDAQLAQARADLATAEANSKLAGITAQRYQELLKTEAVSKQDVDNYNGDYAAKQAMQLSAGANVKKLEEMESFKTVYAPFSGVITLRNVDVGALVNAGNTLLFRVAQTSTLRAYVNVPQTDADSIRPGQPARLSVSNLPGRSFTGTVVRTANSLDPTSRTMLVEVQVPNPNGVLLPGMYAQVDLSSARPDPPLLVPGSALVIRADGTQVAVVRHDHTVHFQKIQIGRDYGDRLEVISGLETGDMIIANPRDTVREGVIVNSVKPAGK
jgi:membrane fusion protein, multidrug efflux system